MPGPWGRGRKCNRVMSLPGFSFVSLLERPDLLDQVRLVEEQSWPEFIKHDPVGEEYWDALYEVFPEYQFAMLEESSGRVVANGNSLPIRWEAPLADLPSTGWDWVLAKGFEDRRSGPPTLQSALSIPILPAYRGRGLSRHIVAHMHSIGAARGLRGLIAPVRPNVKCRYPLTPIERYIAWKDETGLPFDPWVRVHARLGAGVIKVCHASMNVTAPLRDWESWSGLRFPESGPYVVPEALVPLAVDLDAGQGVYLEPNVWMFHPPAEAR